MQLYNWGQQKPRCKNPRTPNAETQVLRGEIAAFNHYCSLRSKTKGQGQHLINPQKNYLH
jgi:hypothetical protein